MAHTLLMGAVAYDPKVVTIWEGFRDWFASRGLHFDYVLYSNYERQVEGLVHGHVHVAWNSPLAWVRAARMGAVRALAMRDTDCDLTSVVVVRADSGIESVEDLAGRTVAVGAVDSPQATLIPLSHLRSLGVDDVKVLFHDIAVGKHGDHVGGERDAARALMSGAADAACMIDGNHLLFGVEGTLPAGSTRIVAQTPPYDHCNFTVASSAPEELVERFLSLLLEMSYDDPSVRPLLDLEGLKAWREGRTSGYAQLERAVEEVGFYDGAGNVTADGYRP
ncbi:MAG TPA: phosphate/phosphite/phosphonate ABC transporter substrate-binding protein [Acidimicrobiales bacterium]|nr:phosphate/phosphite/phosphonate ABC transporter substrate-binding protein [Acidimicrobiales bacterium]